MTLSPGCLLILDDDPAVARTLAVIAEGAGYTTHCFDTPSPFFEAVETLAPSHVALDLIMPGMDGVEVLRRLAERGCDAALILTSGMGQKVLESAQSTARERGLNIVGVLPKPFRSQLLRELLALAKPRAALQRGAAIDVPVDTLAQAIRERRISIAAQPKMDIHTHEVVGAEVLARWHHPVLGHVPPDVFVPLAEANGLMEQFTSLMLQQALAWFSRSPLRTDGSVSVNLSTNCLGDVTLADRVQAACLDVGVSPEQLILEITESSAMDRTADTFDTLTRLRIKGFRLSVDDFGTGYSSLSQLARLPLSELKIDRSFVAKLLTSNDDHKIVDATIRLARGMGLVSVAEGVEDAATLDVLRSLGCNQAQGYHIARPLQGDAFDAWLLARP